MAFASLVVSIDLTDDDEIDPDVAVGLLESATSFLHDLTQEGKDEISSLIIEFAETEANSGRRDALLNLPDALGLLRED